MLWFSKERRGLTSPTLVLQVAVWVTCPISCLMGAGSPAVMTLQQSGFEIRVFLLLDELPLGLMNSICQEKLVRAPVPRVSSFSVGRNSPTREGRVETLLSEAV